MMTMWDLLLLYQIIGATLGFGSAILLYHRYLMERPILKYTIQSCYHDEEGITLNFIVDNSGERGTSITNIALIKLNHKRININPCYTTYYYDGAPISSFIMFIRPRSSLAVTSRYIKTNLKKFNEIDLEFQLVHTTGKKH